MEMISRRQRKFLILFPSHLFRKYNSVLRNGNASVTQSFVSEL